MRQLFALAFAPFAVMAFWLVRLRLASGQAGLTFRAPLPEIPPSSLAGQEPS